MNCRLTTGSILMLGLLLMPVPYAQSQKNVQIEVNVLLGFVGDSGCEFYRNGTWYYSKTAQTHLRDKYNYLAARKQINTTEDFIEMAATKSNLSGQLYTVRCNGGTTMESKQWLRDELVRIRAF
jgi:hypothetical protein